MQAPATAHASSTVSPTLLDLQRISKTYQARDGGSVQAIESVSCQIAEGEFISILGPSGCGKSTLLMLVGNLTPISAGRIVLGGKNVTETVPDFGIVFQDPVLLPWRTVIGNVELAGESGRLPRTNRRDKARELIRLVGLQDSESKYPHELSGGMQQRVAIARALMLSPSLLLMDEPFSALDAMTREQMNLELQRIGTETGATIIFVTHSIPEAAFLSDRVLVMTGRPSTVREIVTIDLPRPRPLELMTSDRFGVYVSHMRRLFSRVEGGR
jgi:NitT/TauT family transport system ATP-binding protein